MSESRRAHRHVDAKAVIKELTTSVIWLNDQGLDIRCVRMRPYKHDGQVLLEVETIVPLKEAQDYQVRLRRRAREERTAREGARDLTKYDVTANGEKHRGVTKRGMMRLLVGAAFAGGGTPQQVSEAVGQSKLRSFPEELDPEGIRRQLMQENPGGKVPLEKRYFCDHPFRFEGKTYVLSNQWGVDAVRAATALCETFPGIEFERSAD